MHTTLSRAETLPSSPTLQPADLSNRYIKNGNMPKQNATLDRKVSDCSLSYHPPPFMKLISKLRSTQKVIKIHEKQQITKKICNETGEEIKTTQLDENANSNKLKVSFSPAVTAIEAISNNCFEELEEIVKNNAFDLNELIGDGGTLLHFASAQGDIDCARILLSYGADINTIDINGWPPIHRAFQRAQLPMVVYLVENGTDMGKYTSLRATEFKIAEKKSKSVFIDVEVFV